MKIPQYFPARLIAMCLLFVCSRGHGIAQLTMGPEHPNLLINGSFEKGMEGWELDSAHKLGQAAIDPGQKHDGHPCLRIDNATADDTYVLQTVSLKPSTRYRLAGWIKATKIVNEGVGKGDSGASLALRESLDRTNWISDAKDWQHVSADFVPGTTLDVKLGPRVGYFFKKSTGTAWFADLSLIELGPESHQPAKATPRKR